MKQHFVDKLQKARDISKTPYKINSGWRCQHHNIDIGGVPNSSHVKGLAVDIQVNNNVERILILEGLIKAGFKRIGISKEFIHVDLDDEKLASCWFY
jgi:uncharacterized protein YcbK (DUF882 family)